MLQDFVQMCRDNGIPKKQAAEILRSFHQSGIVFFFGNVSRIVRSGLLPVLTTVFVCC